jgi:putative transposase
MINQHLQAAIAQGAVSEAIASLQEFIDDRPDAREERKALAVKLVYQGYKYEEIQTILDVSRSFDNQLETSLRGIWNFGTVPEPQGKKKLLKYSTTRRSLKLVANTRIVGSLGNSNINWLLNTM